MVGFPFRCQPGPVWFCQTGRAAFGAVLAGRAGGAWHPGRAGFPTSIASGGRVRGWVNSSERVFWVGLSGFSFPAKDQEPQRTLSGSEGYKVGAADAASSFGAWALAGAGFVWCPSG